MKCDERESMPFLSTTRGSPGPDPADPRRNVGQFLAEHRARRGPPAPPLIDSGSDFEHSRGVSMSPTNRVQAHRLATTPRSSTSRPNTRHVSRGGRSVSKVLFVVLTAVLGGNLAIVGSGATAQAAVVPDRPPKAAGEPDRPHILNIVLDDMRDESVDAMSEYMPKTVEWFEDGREYVNTDVPISSCCPSRADAMTGRYSHNTKVQHQADTPNLDLTTTVQRHLKDADYRTCMVGKYLHNLPASTNPPYFDRFTSWLSSDYNSFNANVDGTVQPINQYATTYTGDRLMTYLEEFAATPEQPWYCYLAIHAPHVQALPDGTSLAVPEDKYATAEVRDCVAPGESDLSDKPAYVGWRQETPEQIRKLCQSQLRALMSVDDQIDRVMTYLEKTDQLDDTMVLLWSDNGHLFGEHNRTSKFVPYLPSVNVPLFVRWPDRFKAGTDHRLASTVDLAPTILEVAGIAPDPKTPMDGRSLLGKGSRKYLLNEYWLDLANAKVPTYAQIHDLRFVYTEYYDEDAGAVTFREFYDLRTDPAQHTNLLNDGDPANDPSPKALSWLASTLAAARTCAGSNCP